MKLRLIYGLAMAGFFTPCALAGGFAINENSANDMGRANAGRVTQSFDASAAYGNPALMTRYEDITASQTLSFIKGTASFDDKGSVDLTGASLGGNTDGFFDSALVPALQVIYPISDRLAAGFSVNAPYGLSSTYNDIWAGRYQGIGSKLTTINLNPSLAYELNDHVSIGGGINIQYAHAELSSAIDFGAVCFSVLGPAPCTPLNLTPQAADGRLDIDGDDWSFGYNAGIAISPNEDVTFGAHFRSKVEHDIEGTADFTVPMQALPLTATGAFADTQGDAKLPLPSTFEAGMSWRASDAVTVYANIIRTNWSVVEELRVDFDNPAQDHSAEELNFVDAHRYGIGADYSVNSDWTVRAGYSFDESAAVAGSRTVRIPDNDRDIYAFGASYSGMETWLFDVAFNRFQFKDTDFRRTGASADLVIGEIKARVDVLSFGVTKRF